MQTDNQMVILAQVLGVYGVHGWVKIKSFSDTHITSYSPWWLEFDDQWVAFEVEQKAIDKYIRVKFGGVDDRDQALQLMDKKIAVKHEQLPTLEEQYYWHDLIGAQVFNQSNQCLGVVDDLIETGAHDVLVVVGEQKRLIPMVKEIYVTHLDITAKRIEVNWDDVED